MKQSYKWLIVLFCVYGVLLYGKYTGANWPDWVRFHLADLLCMPAVLSLLVMAVRMITRRIFFFLDIIMVLVIFVSFSVVFELLLPMCSDDYTGDMVDVFMYLIGAFVFYVYQATLFRIRIE